MNAAPHREERFETKQACSVAVVYEDATTRQRAMAVCDYLVKEFWSQIEFDFHWWDMDSLSGAEHSETTLEVAANSDFVIVCSCTETELTPSGPEWFERWIEHRAGREGALVNLTDDDTAQTIHARHKGDYFRDVARRAMMDYFTSVPPTISGALPNSFEAVELRAAQMSSVLDDILNQMPPPNHFGLNE